MKLKWKRCDEYYCGRLHTATFNGVDVSLYVSVHASDRGSVSLRYKGHSVCTNWEGPLSRGKALAESLAAWWLEHKPMSK